MAAMIGTILNVAGIVVWGAPQGLTLRRALSVAQESFFRVALGVFAVFYGLRLTWLSLTGSFLQILRQLLIVVLAMVLGRLMGRLLRLQELSNRLGRGARERMSRATARERSPANGGRVRKLALPSFALRPWVSWGQRRTG